MGKTGWAFIGTGMIASSIAPLIQGSGAHTIVTVYNRTQEKAQKFAESVGARACADLRDAVADSEVQMVYVAVTAESHYAVAKECIVLGKPVLMEKPFCVSRRQAEELFAFAEKKGVYLAEGMWSWYNPVNQKTREWIKEGRLGQIKSAKLTYCAPILEAFPRLRDPTRAGGALMDNGVYPLSFCYHLFGKPKMLTCTGKLDKGIDMEETVVLQYEGFTAECEISLLKEMAALLTVEGKQGTITTNMYHAAGETTLTYADGKTENFQGYGMFDVEFSIAGKEAAAGRITGETVTKESTLGVLDLLDECRAQMGLVFPFENNK